METRTGADNHFNKDHLVISKKDMNIINASGYASKIEFLARSHKHYLMELNQFFIKIPFRKFKAEAPLVSISSVNPSPPISNFKTANLMMEYPFLTQQSEINKPNLFLPSSNQDCENSISFTNSKHKNPHEECNSIMKVINKDIKSSMKTLNKNYNNAVKDFGNLKT